MKDETQHTPGPWEIRYPEGFKYSIISIESNIEICAIDGLYGSVEQSEANELEVLANVKLIASAPSLLKENTELKDNLEMICNYVSMREFDINVLRSMVEQTKTDLLSK